MRLVSKSARDARTNALVVLFSVLGILVVANVLGQRFFFKMDLTGNKRFTLSEVSKKAVQALDGLDVQVFLSKDLPPTMTVGFGRERNIRGVAQDLMDKLREYESYSHGKMRIVRVSGNVEEKARQAKLQLFSRGETRVGEGGRLEFKKYAIGATFQYKNQMEVFPLAVEPEFFEFEITKRLLRLKEKYEKSLGMKDVLDAGKALHEAARKCNEKIESYEKKGAEEGGGIISSVARPDLASKLRADIENFKKVCDQVAAAVVKAEKLKGKNEYLDQLLESGRAFADMVDEVQKRVTSGEGGKMGLGAALQRLSDLYALVDRDHDTLKNSPGRKAIGFLCGHDEFCPFPSGKSVIKAELAALMAQRNPLMQQFIKQARQIEDQINTINDQIRRGLFVRRGFTVKRIDPGEDIPDDVAVLVVFGPQKPLSERDLYNIDQFLLSGRTVIFFLKNWDVAVYNMRKHGEDFDMNAFDFKEFHRQAVPTNLDDLLKHYGIQVNRDLVMERSNFDRITVIQVERQGQYAIQSQRDFPYPLLPTFTNLDRSHVLAKGLANITLPYVSSMTVTEEARKDPKRKYVELMRSSDDAIATNDSIPLAPHRLLPWVAAHRPNGPGTVAIVASGELESYFKGKKIPKPEEKKDEKGPTESRRPERPFKERGKGRLLVVGSDLGLENLSPERVFEGFNMSQLSSGSADYFLKLKDYVANFQNWQLRLAQIAPVIQRDLDFLYNCLDWGIQEEALAEIRSKGLIYRPIVAVSQGVQTATAAGFIFGLPFLFVMFGVVRYLRRRRGA